jgi:hypothetical protein
MGIYTKKTWSDSVIEAANRAQTNEEKQLQIVLDGIIVIKESPDLTKTIEFDLDTGKGAEEADRIYRTHALMHDLMRVLSKKHERPSFIWDYQTHKPRLRLHYPKKGIFSDLIQNLQDPEWVAALRHCSDYDCRKFILSISKWAKEKNKFCSEECKRRYHGRKSKKNRKKKKRDVIEDIERELESKIVERPGNSDNPDRIRINKKRFEVIMRCGECRHMILGKKFDNYLKRYSGPEKCTQCGATGLRYFLTTSDREEYKYTVSEWEELVIKYKSEGGFNNDMGED